MSRFAAHLVLSFLAAPLLALPLRAAPVLHLSSAGAPGGAKVSLLLTLTGAEEAAGIRTQINFDPQVLSFERATPGQLGSLFDFTAGVLDGCLYLTLARPDQLSSGQGILARLVFAVNPGARPGLRTDLAMAQAMVINQRGAKLSLDAGPVALSGASVLVTDIAFAEFVDLDNDHLGDDWEDAHGLSVEQANAFEDPDHDGRVNLLEFALGSEPLVADPAAVLIAGRALISGEEYLILDYSRNKAATNCAFVLERTENFINWAELPAGYGSTEITDLGQTEGVRIRESQPMKLSDARFYRLKVIAR